MIKIILLLSMVFPAARASDLLENDFWVKPIKQKLLVGAKSVELEVEWQDPNIQSFCNNAKTYLENHLRDYEKYDCENLTNLNKVFCETVKKEFTMPTIMISL